MIKVDMDVLPRALAEIVPGVTIGNTTGETIKVTVELDRLPAAPATEVPSVPVILASPELVNQLEQWSGPVRVRVTKTEVGYEMETRAIERRNVHCSNCGDTRGGPIGHETQECTFVSGDQSPHKLPDSDAGR